MTSVSKTTVDRERIIQNVVDAIDHHLVPMAGEVVRVIYEDKPLERVTVSELFSAVGRTLVRKMGEERAADMAFALDELETEEARALRDDVFGTKVERVRAYRNGLQASYGNAVLATFGLSDQVPTTPHRLVPYAENVAMRLEKRELTQTPHPGMPIFDTKAMAAELRTMNKQLEEALEGVGREVREDQLARARRDQIRASSWRTYQALTTAVEGLFRLIERDDLADRVRLTNRRRAGLPEPVDMEFGDPQNTPFLAEPALDDA
ncbi:MAG: hypothetical protein H0U74_19600 [Bradymonadaceae bacterium]|nr:hypothetical protein [Lujinxingiaceae bacterium]